MLNLKLATLCKERSSLDVDEQFISASVLCHTRPAYSRPTIKSVPCRSRIRPSRRTSSHTFTGTHQLSLFDLSSLQHQYVGIRVDISQFDLSNTTSRVNDVRIANFVLISLVIVTVSLRLLARIKFVKRIFADDGTCVQRAVVQAC
jgi:hypothetical protein